MHHSLRKNTHSETQSGTSRSSSSMPQCATTTQWSRPEEWIFRCLDYTIIYMYEFVYAVAVFISRWRELFMFMVHAVVLVELKGSLFIQAQIHGTEIL